jgi:hypothetical protein
MKTTNLLLVCFITTLLGACGGGGGTAAPPQSPPPPPPPVADYANPIRLDAFESLGRASDGRALQPGIAAIADLNGDGLDDAIVHLVREGNALSSPGELTPVVILLNNGAGNLVPGNSGSPPLGGIPGATPIIDGSNPMYFIVRQVLIEDFNQDGQPDVFFETHGIEPDGNPDLFPGEQNGLWLSGPDGKLTDVSATHLPQHSDFTHGASVADIDGDSDLDIWANNLGANNVPAYLMTNDGSGRFTAVADLGFGDPDDNGPNLGPNGRLPEVIRNGNAPFWSAFADVDGDSDEDLYLGFIGFEDGVGIDNRAVLLINDSTGVFVLAPSEAVPMPPFGGTGRVQELVKYDLNSDGRQDLVLSVSDGNPDNFLAGTEFQFLVNNGAGGFVDETSARFVQQTDTGTARREIWFADLDGDGDDDFLTGTFDRREIYENDGSGVFTLIDPNIFQFDWWFLPLDLDGDGQGTDFLHVQGNGDGELEFFVTKREP